MKIAIKRKNGSEYVFGCTGKIPYFSQQEAKHFLRVSHAKEIYRCSSPLFDKDHWHVTSVPKGQQKRIVRKLKTKFKYIDLGL